MSNGNQPHYNTRAARQVARTASPGEEGSRYAEWITDNPRDMEISTDPINESLQAIARTEAEALESPERERETVRISDPVRNLEPQVDSTAALLKYLLEKDQERRESRRKKTIASSLK